MQMKIDANIAGLGVGYLPENRAAAAVAAGQLQILQVANLKADGDLYAVWKPNRTGKALRWFAKALAQPDVQTTLMRDTPVIHHRVSAQSADNAAGRIKRPVSSAKKIK